jgi:hypothetical protein
MAIFLRVFTRHDTNVQPTSPRFLLAVEAVSDRFYAIGGSATGWASLAAVEAFTP